jgi:hypothetical protein
MTEVSRVSASDSQFIAVASLVVQPETADAKSLVYFRDQHNTILVVHTNDLSNYVYSHFTRLVYTIGNERNDDGAFVVQIGNDDIVLKEPTSQWDNYMYASDAPVTVTGVTQVSQGHALFISVSIDGATKCVLVPL